jgi:hypothetical protein
MGGACSTHGGDEKCIQNLGWKAEGNTTLKTSAGWEFNIKIGLTETGLEGVAWIHLAQDMKR